MAKGRAWTSEQKAKIVLQGLRGRSVAELCNEYQIHQTQYYKWRDKFLENAARVFDTDKQTQKEQRLERENQKLKQVVGELTIELKKKRLVKRARQERISCADAEILPLVRELKASHPFWGYRRIWAHLRFIKDFRINRKRVYRLLKENSLLVAKNLRLRAKRVPQPSKPKPARPNQWWGVDMTKAQTDGGWAYIVVVNDWFTKKILGAFVGSRSRAGEWLEAINQAVCRQFPEGIREAGNLELRLMSDNGSQPTSLKFMREAASLGIQQTFTSYCNPKGNADTEWLIRTIKEELIWLREWTSTEELAEAVSAFVEEFNQNYLHSALGYKTPSEFEKQWFSEQQMALSAAA